MDERRWLQQVPVALDLHLLLRLLDLGWRMHVRTFRRLVLAGALVAVPAIGFGVTLLGRLAHDHATEVLVPLGVDPGPLALAGVLAMLGYVAVGYGVRETMTERRRAVAGAADADVLRALDLDARARFTIACLVRITALHVVLATVVAGIVAAWFDALVGVPLGPVLPALALVASWSVLSALSASNATGRRAAARRRGVVVGLVLASFLAGASAGSVLRAVAGLGIPRGVVTPASSLLATGLLGLIGLSLLSLRRSWGLMATTAHRVDLPQGGEGRATIGLAGGSGLRDRVRDVATIVVGELRAGSAGRVLGGVYLVLVSAVALATGLRVVHGPVLPADLGPDALVRVGALAMLPPLLVVLETALARAGPRALRPQLRVAWELGSPRRALVLGTAGVHAATAVAVGGLVAAVVALLTAHVVAWLVVAPLSLLGAALVAESLSVALHELPDGTVRASLVVGLLTIVLGLPPLVLAAWQPPVGPIVVSISSLLLMGGGTWLMSERILALPSTFVT